MYGNKSNRTDFRHFKRYRNCHFKKTENGIWQVNYKYIQEKQGENQQIEVEIVSSEKVNVDEVEMDEMWSFVHDKSRLNFKVCKYNELTTTVNILSLKSLKYQPNFIIEWCQYFSAFRDVLVIKQL